MFPVVPNLRYNLSPHDYFLMKILILFPDIMKRYSERSVSRHQKYTRQLAEDVESSSSSDEEFIPQHPPEFSTGIEPKLPTYNDFITGIPPQRTSSPLLFFNEVSVLSSSSDSLDTSSSLDDPLFKNSTTSTSKFSSDFLVLKSKHCISDAGAEAMLRLFTDALPIPNACPSLSKLLSSIDLSEEYREVKVTSGSYFLLNIQSQLQQIIATNSDIFDIPSWCDISDIVNAQSFNHSDSDSIKYIYVVLNIDGMASVFSSKMYHIWPVFASILNLHPFKRRQFRNLVFCMMYYGSCKPDFTHFLQELVKQLISTSFSYDGLTVRVKVVTLIADLPAKALCLNMSQFNGYYGCSVCLARGSYDSSLHRMLYPINDLSPIRTEASYRAHIDDSERTGSPSHGVKGPTPLSSLMAVPIVPLDSMHLLYLGIVKTIVQQVLRQRWVNENNVNDILKRTCVPITLKRKPRSLLFKSKFKASEWKLLILYFFVAFFDSEYDSVKFLVSSLATLIHLLNKIYVTEDDCNNARILIDMFQRISLQLFGPAVQSYSMHALKHLPLLTKRFGALWSCSASMFESSYHQLKRPLSGTRNEGGLIVKRFLYNKAQLTSPCQNVSFKVVVPVGTTYVISDFSELLEYNVPFSQSAVCVYRFRVDNLLFHSFAYPKKRSSASYYAVLENGNFVKIDHIMSDKGSLNCCCTLLTKTSNAIDLIESSHPEKSVLKECCSSFVIDFGSKIVVPAVSFKRNLIVISVKNAMIGTPVCQDFEHD